MARSLWKGAISFGLVHIPVEMHTAVTDSSLSLSMLDKRDFSPIGFKRYNKNTEQEVTWDNIVKGYEYRDGEYVVLSEEDLRQANVEATQTIDIHAFVDADQVPLLYYDTPYYLAPGKGGDKVYALLRETLKEAGKIGIATVVIRVKQHLAALVCVDDTIVLNTLRYEDEIKSVADLKIPDADSPRAKVTDKELKMALALVDGMSEEWNPKQYHDTYREDVLALVEEKVKKHQIHTITEPGPERERAAPSNVVDLVALLQKSLGSKPAKGRAAAANDEEEAPPKRRTTRAAAASKSTRARSSSKSSSSSSTARKRKSA